MIVWLALLLWPVHSALANPWADPGDLVLRHDLQLLQDAGLMNIPLATWPISLPDVARDLDDHAQLDVSSEVRAANRRVWTRLRREMKQALTVPDRVAPFAATDPKVLRSFENTPRENFGVGAGANFFASYLAVRARVGIVDNPDDGQTIRPDGSYAAVLLEDWALSVGYVPRWWGPGWHQSLVFSTQARPVPSITIERLHSDAPEMPVLKWLGPWKLAFLLGQWKNDEDWPNLFFGTRLQIKPTPWLELAVSRLTPWCDENHECVIEGVFNSMVQRNDSDDAWVGGPSQQYVLDLRLRSPLSIIPVAIYGQGVGDGRPRGPPKRYIYMVGAEAWGGLFGSAASWRLFAEYADTRPYHYEKGYADDVPTVAHFYHRQSLGQAVLRGRLLSLGAMVAEPDGDLWQLLFRYARENDTTVSEVAPYGIDLSYDLRWDYVQLALGGGLVVDEDSNLDGRVFLMLTVRR